MIDDDVTATPPDDTDEGDVESDIENDAENDAESDVERAAAPAAASKVRLDRKGRPVPKRDRGLLIASFVIACGLALIVWGFFSAITGTEGIDRPDAIEDISPVENALQVLQQDRIVVDLQFGYEAELIIDGIRLETINIGEIEVQPGRQLDLSGASTAVFDPGNSIISFQPSDDAVITEFTQGRHQARVEYWLIEDPDNRRSYNWTFVVV